MWWVTPRVQKSLLLVIDREERQLSVNASLFAHLQTAGLDVQNAYRTMIERSAAIAQFAKDDEASGQAVEGAIWDNLEDLLLAHTSLVKAAAFERSTSAPIIPIPDDLIDAIPTADSERDEAQIAFSQLRDLTVSLEQSDETAKQALEEARSESAARRELQTLIARSGDRSLSEEFSALAKKETDSAASWTKWSIVVTGFGVIAGLVVHGVFDGQPTESKIVYSLLVAAGFAGVATYFARLAGHHRHTAQWAKSVAVQLDSYARFVEHTDDEGRKKVFDQFAARVLGPPPPRSEKAAVQSATIADIAAIAARNPT
ncbi:hypothetical protein CHE218_05510 [Microbacterium sp. che218]